MEEKQDNNIITAISIHLDKYPIEQVLKLLLKDKTTGKNIIWATNDYLEYGPNYADNKEITVGALTGIGSIILQPRVMKNIAQQSLRTKQKAEVFTPSWIVNMMNNFTDEDWFGTSNVFNVQNTTTWNETEKIKLDDLDWQKYIDTRHLEITCGEAPYLVSRYDTTTGKYLTIKHRIGILDRKLRVIAENTDCFEEWYPNVIKALKSIYGYEYQGDNLLIARCNILLTVADNTHYYWKRELNLKQLKELSNIIVWNLWQMDGLSNTVPLGIPKPMNEQLSLFDMSDDKQFIEVSPYSKIYNWRSKKSINFFQIGNGESNMKFDYIIGNPPYQDETTTNNRALK